MLSGTLKELYTDYEDNQRRLLVIDGDGVMYVCYTYTSLGSFNTEVGRDTGIKHFDSADLYAHWGVCSITAIDGNNIFYRSMDSDGNTKQDKKNSTLLEFKSTLLDGRIVRMFAYDSNDHSSITLLTEDDKILTISIAKGKDSIKFEADAPEGNVIYINTTLLSNGYVYDILFDN